MWQEIDQEWWKEKFNALFLNLNKIFEKDTFAEQEKKSKCLGYLKLKPIKELDESNLPSNRQVLKHFFCFTKWSYISNIPKKKIAEKPLIEINERYIKYHVQPKQI